MSNVAELSRDGSLAASAAASEAVDTQRLFLPAQWVREALVALLVDQAVSEVVSEEVLTADEDEVDSEEDFKIVEAMEEVVEEEEEVEEVLATKEAGASKAGEVTGEETVVGMLGRMAMALHQMPQLVQEVVVVVVSAAEAAEAADTAEGGMVLALQIVLPKGVGMTRVVAVAHMMTETPDTVAAIEAMETVMEDHGVEAAATWSR